MTQDGIDISKQRPRIITKDIIIQSSVSLNMDCIENESCSMLFTHNVTDWNMEDQKIALGEGRKNRNIVRIGVKQLVSNLGEANQQVNFESKRSLSHKLLALSYLFID